MIKKNKSIKVVTWNVNSIRTRLPHIIRYIENAAPDIILLQEIKCQDETFPYADIEAAGYKIAMHGQKSYNGVAILSRYDIEEVRKMNFHTSKEEARYIECIISIDGKKIIAASIYVPNGRLVGSPWYKDKLAYYSALEKHLISLSKSDDIYIIGGDFNVAPDDVDVHSPETMRNSIGFHIDERNAFFSILDKGYLDVYRHKNADAGQEFSWWDYRNRQSFAANRGMRIDHILIHQKDSNKILAAGIDKECRTEDRPSDHCPVWCEILL